VFCEIIYSVVAVVGQSIYPKRFYTLFVVIFSIDNLLTSCYYNFFYKTCPKSQLFYKLMTVSESFVKVIKIKHETRRCVTSLQNKM